MHFREKSLVFEPFTRKLVPENFIRYKYMHDKPYMKNNLCRWFSYQQIECCTLHIREAKSINYLSKGVKVNNPLLFYFIRILILEYLNQSFDTKVDNYTLVIWDINELKNNLTYMYDKVN